jgi:thiamine kinase-like enzyme
MNFYQKVRSRHIPGIFYNHSEGDQHWLLLEDVDGQHPAGLSRGELFDLARRARKIIRALNHVEPYRYSISEKGYDDFAESTIELLRKLHHEGKLKMVNEEVIARIGEVLSHPEVRHTVRGRCAMLHGDLKCDNMLIRPDGDLVIIDWQSVLFGPEEIDIYSLMATQAMDPVPIAGIGPEILRMTLEMRWFADCLDYWMPTAGFLDPWMANIEKYMRHIVENNGYTGMDVYYFH